MTTSTKELIERLNNLTPEQVEQISGGLSCSPDEIVGVFNSLTQIYESAVDFTSHVIERVNNAV